MSRKRPKKLIRSKGIRPGRRFGRLVPNPQRAGYTTRHGEEFKGKGDARLACDALGSLEAEEIDPPHALAWLVEHSFATDDQPENHDEHLIQLVDGRDIQWNDERGQWEPGAWLYP